MALVLCLVGFFAVRSGDTADRTQIPTPLDLTSIPDHLREGESIIPNLIGLDHDQVQANMAAAGLYQEAFGTPGSEASAVTWHSPKAGTVVPKASIVVVMYGTNDRVLKAAQNRATDLGWGSDGTTRAGAEPGTIPGDTDGDGIIDDPSGGHGPWDDPTARPLTPEEEASLAEVFPPLTIEPQQPIVGGTLVMSWSDAFTPADVTSTRIRVVGPNGAILVDTPAELGCQTIPFRYTTPVEPRSGFTVEAVIVDNVASNHALLATQATGDGARLYLQATGHADITTEEPARPTPVPRFHEAPSLQAPERCQ